MVDLQRMAENLKDKDVWLQSTRELGLNVKLIELGDIVIRYAMHRCSKSKS